MVGEFLINVYLLIRSTQQSLKWIKLFLKSETGLKMFFWFMFGGKDRFEIERKPSKLKMQKYKNLQSFVRCCPFKSLAMIFDQTG